MLTPNEILTMKERLVKATAGPWFAEDHKEPLGQTGDYEDMAIIRSDDDSHIATVYNPNETERATYDFIAHARTDMPKLLLDREELQAENERLKLDLKCEQINQPFYTEISDGFEESLGPHPTIRNGQWITRCKEQRQELDSLRRDKERLTRVLRDLHSASTASDFNEHWEEYTRATDTLKDAAIAQERKGEK